MEPQYFLYHHIHVDLWSPCFQDHTFPLHHYRKRACLAAPGAWHLSGMFHLERGTAPADTKVLPDEISAVACHSNILYAAAWPPTEHFIPLKSGGHGQWDLQGLPLILEPACVSFLSLLHCVWVRSYQVQVHFSSSQATPGVLSLI